MAGCAAVLGLAALASAQEAVFESAPCPFELPLAHVEGQTVECGFLGVPESRGDPDSRRIELAVALFRNPAGTTHPDPIVYLAGGPGASTLELLRFTFTSSYGFLFATGRDVVLFDQRGVGVSRPALDCTDATRAGLVACGARLAQQADLTRYNSLASAADVDALRRALGYEQVNLFGGSYGTRLALEVLRDFPHGVRSAVLDAVYPPDVDVYVEGPQNADRAFGVLFERCAADAACAGAYFDLRALLLDVQQRLNATPASVLVRHPLSGQLQSMLVNGDTLVAILFNLLYEASLLPWLPRIVHDAGDGHFELVSEMLGSLLLVREMISIGMALCVQCHEELAFSDRAAFEAAAAPFPYLAGVLDGSLVGRLAFDVCPSWPVGRAQARENEAVASDVPALLLAGEFDPVTPPRWAAQAAASLSRGRLLVFPSAGHGASVTACGQRAIQTFIGDPAAPLDTSCLAEPALRFKLPTDPLPTPDSLARVPPARLR